MKISVLFNPCLKKKMLPFIYYIYIYIYYTCKLYKKNLSINVEWLQFPHHEAQNNPRQIDILLIININLDFFFFFVLTFKNKIIFM